MSGNGYEPRWDIDYERGYQGELFIEDIRSAVKAGAAIETKTDDRAADTGRIYIEYECLGKPSGITTTAAPIWAYVLGRGVALWFPTETLKQLARAAWRDKKNRVACTRGSHPTRGVVIALDDIPRMLREISMKDAA